MRLFLLLLTISLGSCFSKEDGSPYLPLNSPMGEVPQPEHNRATQKGVELGKKLFFDPRLSQTGTVSCATCHHPDKSFSDGLTLSNTGISGNTLLRHSPALFNLAWYRGFFWDGGSKNLESQAFGPLTHEDEMGVNLIELCEKLQKTEYPELFKEVWGDDTITSQRIVRALAQYQRSLLSFGSPYDEALANKTTLSPELLAGKAIYTQYCAPCHTEGLFTDLGYHANGMDSLIEDRSHELMYWGRYRITNDSSDIGKYKTPSLRNLSFTAPYMHDGRFRDLNAVLNHYFRDHSNNPLADSILRNGNYAQVGENEKRLLLLFLKSLDDEGFNQ